MGTRELGGHHELSDRNDHNKTIQVVYFVSQVLDGPETNDLKNHLADEDPSKDQICQCKQITLPLIHSIAVHAQTEGVHKDTECEEVVEDF